MMLQAALQAQARGFWIFPVARNDKVPHRLAGYRDAAGAFHGWGETATNDINQIVHFWTQVDPHANIGIACKPSQLLVVDLDEAKEDYQLRGTEWEYLHAATPRADGVLLFDEMVYKLGEGDQAAWDTYSVRTRSGGLHLYYRWPASWSRISQASPVKGVVDVRGNGGQYGGYVLAEGSRVGDGEYRPDVSGGKFPIALPPQWIRQLVVEKPQAPRIRQPRGLMQPGSVSFSGLVASVRNAGEGNRNNACAWASRTMCEEGATVEEALRILGPAAEEAGLPGIEVERTIRSAYRTQERKG